MQSLVEFMNRDRLKKYKIYNYSPESKEELQKIIKQLIKERGRRADLNDIDTSSVYDMSHLFEGSKFNGDISQWNVSKVLDMSYMFFESGFNGDIENWDVSNVKNMCGMFHSATNFDKPLGKWGSKTKNVTNMKEMFFHCKSFDQDINDWNVSNVGDMSSMFAMSSFNKPLDKWKPTNAYTMRTMFSNNYSFDQDLSSWGPYVKNVMNFESMFWNCSDFDRDLSSWDINPQARTNMCFADCPLESHPPKWYKG